MMFFDMPLEELQTYKPPREEPPDFDAYNHFTGPRRYGSGDTMTTKGAKPTIRSKRSSS